MPRLSARHVECPGSCLTGTRNDRNQAVWGDNGCGVMPNQSLRDFLREQCNLVALEEIHGTGFPSALLPLNPEQYLFPPFLSQTAHFCLLSLLRSFYSPCLFLQPCLGFALPSGFWDFRWLQGLCRASWLPHCWSGCCWCPGEPACYWLWELLLGPVLPRCQCHSKKGWVFSVCHWPPGREEGP